jgi:hypothetical protein
MRWLDLVVGSILCTACSEETPGEVVRVRWELDQSAQAERADFETRTGYRVHLDEARVELRAVYLYAPAAAHRSAIAWLEQRLISVAQAHGGLDNEKGRRVLAEWTKPMSLDVLSDSPVPLAKTDAEGGAIDAVKLQLAEGVIAHVRGHAERDGQRWYFETDITPNEGVSRSVELPALDERLSEGAVVRLTVQPKVWLDLCELSRLAASGQIDDSPAFMPIPADNQVGRALSIGVRSPNGFQVRIAPAEAADDD